MNTTTPHGKDRAGTGAHRAAPPAPGAKSAPNAVDSWDRRRNIAALVLWAVAGVVLLGGLSQWWQANQYPFLASQDGVRVVEVVSVDPVKVSVMDGVSRVRGVPYDVEVGAHLSVLAPPGQGDDVFLADPASGRRASLEGAVWLLCAGALAWLLGAAALTCSPRRVRRTAAGHPTVAGFVTAVRPHTGCGPAGWWPRVLLGPAQVWHVHGPHGRLEVLTRGRKSPPGEGMVGLTHGGRAGLPVCVTHGGSVWQGVARSRYAPEQSRPALQCAAATSGP